VYDVEARHRALATAAADAATQAAAKNASEYGDFGQAMGRMAATAQKPELSLNDSAALTTSGDSMTVEQACKSLGVQH
jgi:hypothetical protein